jgi:type VI secretion system protein ImpE
MTPHEALAEGRLAEAVALQEATVADHPTDPAARRLLVDLLLFAGRLDAAARHLAAIRSDAPDWPEQERSLYRLIRSEQVRSGQRRRPRFRPDPPPKHMARRWLAVRASLRGRPDRAVRHADAADAAAPCPGGFLDGQEFQGLRDADDRFASVLEVFLGGEYFWFAWESLRRVSLAPARGVLDHLYRPATLTRTDGTTVDVHLPLVYPGSYLAGDEFALGTEIDYLCPDGGLTRCVGGKLLLLGAEEGDELPLSRCRLIEFRRLIELG